ncbi:Intradiol ring-cleavage dioxygenase [Mucidula mucida]|nr:Intradiol ring-cleavage dioxygenase [Mucidula mucida]
MFPLYLLSFASLAIFAAAHPGEVYQRLSARDLAAREAAASKRHLQARNCAAEISAFNARRKSKRELARRGEDLGARAAATVTATAENPTYTELQNTSCITAPEVTEGPYYINNEFVRQDLTETQTGVTLVLDIGVLDTTTCEPLPAAFVEIWAANATGVYGGYAAGGGGGPPPTLEARQGPGGGSSPVVRNETFLRGGLATDENGITELITIYPGYYTGRTAHIHTMVHLNYEVADNGTLISHGGSLLHIGQFFFDESWNDDVFATEPYTLNTQTRTLNSDDGILNEANSDGNNAFLDLDLIGASLEDGILGYITVGVDSTASYTISNTNYLNSTGATVVREEPADVYV